MSRGSSSSGLEPQQTPFQVYAAAEAHKTAVAGSSGPGLEPQQTPFQVYAAAEADKTAIAADHAVAGDHYG